MAAPPGSEPAWRSDSSRALSLGTLATVLYLCTAPAVVNADGLGYLKLLPHNFAAGHLLYMPLLRAATQPLGDGLRAGRLVNALLGGTGVVLMYGIVRRTLGALPLGRPYAASDVRFAATFAAAGLAVSYGYWVQGSDVEAYAAAMVALLCTVRLLLAYRAQPTLAARGRGRGAARALGVVPPHARAPHPVRRRVPGTRTRAAARSWPRRAGGRARRRYLAIGALRVRRVRRALPDLARRARLDRHRRARLLRGGGAYRLADAIYGLAKAVVWSPYLYEADAQKLIGQFLLGLLPLVRAWPRPAWSRARRAAALDVAARPAVDRALRCSGSCSSAPTPSAGCSSCRPLWLAGGARWWR